MKFGVLLANSGGGLPYPSGIATAESIIHVGKNAEDLGFNSIAANDHITPPERAKTLKPNFFEPLSTLSFLGGMTSHIRLITEIIMLPFRNIVILAKQAATLDVLSNGRLTLGVGVGRYKDEFDALNVPFDERVAIMVEGIQALRELFTKPSASFNGRHVKFSNVELHPKPAQDPLPIWIGALTEPSIKKTGRLGDGWFPGSFLPEEYENGLQLIAESAKKANRDPLKIDVAGEHIISIEKNLDDAVKKFKEHSAVKHMISVYQKIHGVSEKAAYDAVNERNFVGTPADVMRQLEKYAKIRNMHISFNFASQTLEEMLNGMRLFSREVMPSFAKR